jgi:hypothetical protein
MTQERPGGALPVGDVAPFDDVADGVAVDAHW